MATQTREPAVSGAEELIDPLEAARAAGLHYFTDARPGIRRKRSGGGFAYVGPDGRAIRDEKALRRIRSLAIPPAWTDVWICPDPRGHLQATGRDARGRKQYRYHPRWRVVRDEAKYGRMIAFAQSLPNIRKRTAEHLRLEGLPREKVLATVVRLLESTLIRVGNEEYARENESFGLTTLRDKHVKVDGSKVRFRYRGKSGKEHAVEVNDRRLAKIVKQCRDIPGQDLFQYVDDDGARRDVTSGDVNDYLREITGEDFTAKDFRTWAGTVAAALALAEFEEFDTQAKRKKNIVRAVENVAAKLGNTPAVCRKCYVHPAILDAYLDGVVVDALRREVESELRDRLHGLDAEEAAVLAFLRERLKEEAEARSVPLEEQLRKSVEHTPESASKAAGSRSRRRGKEGARVSARGAPGKASSGDRPNHRRSGAGSLQAAS